MRIGLAAFIALILVLLLAQDAM